MAQVVAIGLAILASLSNGGIQAEPIKGTVLSIGDGDTIRVLDHGRRITVRLACIDAPEMSQSPYGARSRAYLQSRLRIGAPVTLLPQTVDRYGRTVAEVIGEVNLGLAMVEDGQAFAYRKHLRQCNAKEYLDAEHRASRRRYGVWQVPGGITRPWDFCRSRTSARPVDDAGSIPGVDGIPSTMVRQRPAQVCAVERTGQRTIGVGRITPCVMLLASISQSHGPHRIRSARQSQGAG